MHPSFRVAHRPLISFVGKRHWPPGPQRQLPHPAAPAQLKETFSNFLEKYNSLSPSSGNVAQKNPRQRIFNDFWEAPGHVWRPRIRQLEDAEIDAVLSGGASLR